MNAKEVKLLRDSLAEKCFSDVFIIDNDSGKFIIEDNGQFFIVKIDVCKELPYELLNRFQEKRSQRKAHQLRKKVKNFFT